MKQLFTTFALAAGFIAGSAFTSAQAQTVLDFNDLGPSTGGTHMVDGYGGFNWTSSDWHFMSLASAPENTFLALSGTATAIFATGGPDFYFDGADFWSRRGLDATGRFYYILDHDGVIVYDGRLDRSGRNDFTGVPTTFKPNYAGPVDGVAVVFDQGGGDWDHLAMDNFRFTPVTNSTPTTPPTSTNPTNTPPPTTSTVITYKLAVKTSGKGSVAVSRTGTTFVAGTVLTLTATPAVGSAWKGWSGDVTSLDRTVTVTMTKAMTITANFK